MMRRLAVILALLCLLLPSCTEKKPPVDQAAVLAAAAELLPRSVEINEIFFGPILPHQGEEGALGVYVPLSSAWSAQHEIYTVQDIKDRVEEVFAPYYYEWLYEIRLGSIFTDSGVASYTSYYDLKKEDGSTVLMQSTARPVLMNGSMSYDLTTLQFVGERNGVVTLSVEATVTTADQKSLTETLEFQMCCEGGVWLLRSNTYFAYRESANT